MDLTGIKETCSLSHASVSRASTMQRSRFKREGTYIHLKLKYVDICQNPAQYYKANYPSIKMKERKKKKETIA